MTQGKNVAYLRFSPRPGGQSESCELQLDRIQAWAKSQGQTIDGVYRDENKSGGTTEGRDALESALASVCESRGTLCCYSLSRLSRSVRDALEISERLSRAGAGLVLLDLGLDTNTPVGKMLFTIIAAVAELERSQIAQRTSDAMKRHSKNGRRMGRYARYGWDLEGVPVRSEQYAIARVKFLAGCEVGGLPYSESMIATAMNREQYEYRGRRWKERDIKKILGLT